MCLTFGTVKARFRPPLVQRFAPARKTLHFTLVKRYTGTLPVLDSRSCIFYMPEKSYNSHLFNNGFTGAQRLQQTTKRSEDRQSRSVQGRYLPSNQSGTAFRLCHWEFVFFCCCCTYKSVAANRQS